MTRKDAERDKIEAIEKLQGWLKPGDAVTTVIRHVSRSGMQRSISCMAPIKNEYGELLNLDPWIVRAGLGRFDEKNGGVKVTGCGMDMGFHLVYNLSWTLYKDGFDCIGDSDQYSRRCPSNDHSNDGYKTADQIAMPISARYSPDRHHADGGYALRQRWL